MRTYITTHLQEEHMKPLRDLNGKEEEIKHFYTILLLTNVMALTLIDLIILEGIRFLHRL